MQQHDKVANELKTDRFIGFLLDESIEDLALRASQRTAEDLGRAVQSYFAPRTIFRWWTTQTRTSAGVW